MDHALSRKRAKPAATIVVAKDIDCLRSFFKTGITSFRDMRTALRRLERTLPDILADGSLETAEGSILASEFQDYVGAYAASARSLTIFDKVHLEELFESAPSLYGHLLLEKATVAFRRGDYDEVGARVAEARSRFDVAGEKFGLALCSFHEARLNHRKHKPEEARSAGLQTLEMFTGSSANPYRAALSHLLLAWIAFWTNAGGEMESHLLQAAGGLQNFDDPVHQGRIALVRALAGRASSSTSIEFDAAAALFGEARKQFQAAGHVSYLATTKNNFGLLQVRRGEFTAAARTLAEYADAPSELPPRVRVENLYFKSRLHLEQGDAQKALAAADKTIAQARLYGLISLETEATIVKARAQFSSDDPTVNDTVDTAEKLIAKRANRRVEAAYWLLEAERECRRRRPDKDLAEACLKKAVDSIRPLTNVYLQSWADHIAFRLAHLFEGALYLRPRLPSLAYDAHKRQLKIWLIVVAISRSARDKKGLASRADVAKSLGVRRQLLEHWLKRLAVFPDDSSETRADIAHIQKSLRPRKSRTRKVS